MRAEQTTDVAPSGIALESIVHVLDIFLHAIDHVEDYILIDVTQVSCLYPSICDSACSRPRVVQIAFEDLASMTSGLESHPKRE